MAVFTVLFPANVPFWSDFVGSINKQTFRDFDVVIADDGTDNSAELAKSLNPETIILPVSGNPARIRDTGVKFLSSRHYDSIVFADSDDLLAPDRLSNAYQLLTRYDAVCNDLDRLDESGSVLSTNVWGDRLDDGFEFDRSFLEDKNIAGLGNTAIRGEILKRHAGMPEWLKAPDWFLFFTLLRDGIAVFTWGGKTLYRQHAGNDIGLRQIDEARLRRVVDTKRVHYEALRLSGFDASSHLKHLDRVESGMNNQPSQTKQFIEHLNAKGLNYFWWEETNHLLER